MDRPDDPDLVAQGLVCMDQGRPYTAIDLFRQQLERVPGHVSALANCANALLAVGRAAEALPIFRQLLEGTRPPLRDRIASNYLVSLQYRPDIEESELLTQAQAVGALWGPPNAQAEVRPAKLPRRVGFISADLCDHPVGFFLLPLLEQLDRRVIEPVLFSTGGREDATAGTLRGLAEWHDVRAFDHEAVLARLRAHQLDVMVDLSGHTAGNRLPVLARRAAPCQLSWLGYFATTGVAAIDHVLMDPWHAPTGTEAQFTEGVIRLPHNRFCFKPATFAPGVTAAPCLKNGFVTFGSFNNTAKYNPAVYAAWASLLQRVPGSRLVLKWPTFADPLLCGEVMRLLTSKGAEPGRIELRTGSVHREVLDQYADIDIALDPFPFSGGHTSCEALWMGIPVVTLPGRRTVSRQTFSFIANLARPDWLAEWVAASPVDYVDKAAALAFDPARLAFVRAALRPAMASSPLTDARRFAADFEAAVAGLVPVNRQP